MILYCKLYNLYVILHRIFKLIAKLKKIHHDDF
jgi:hypothetical protein